MPSATSRIGISIAPFAALGAASLLALLGAGCATTPPVTADADFCGFQMQEMQVDQPPERIPPLSPFAAPGGPDPAVLFLSGGSQHGAFGAGMLEQWKRQAESGRLPRFRVVTGISTGAMMATAAFLDRPELAVKAYTIENERELLTTFVKMNNGQIATHSYPSLLRHNAVADLEPLRRALMNDLVPMAVLEEVADQSAGRTLWVGVVDVDAGKAVALDLTDMAKRAASAARHGDSGKAERLHDCYVLALIASSSAPLAAPPVFIDNRLYIDGGARYGVFANGVAGKAGLPRLGRPDDREKGDGPPDDVYVIVNGAQENGAQCGKLGDPKHPLPDVRLCPPDGADDIRNFHGAHRKWELFGLAERTADILANQVYRYSVAEIYERLRQAAPNDYDRKWHYAHIHRAEMLAYTPQPPHPQAGQSCGASHDADGAALHPVQFYPHYMLCVMDYGRSRVRLLGWGTAAWRSDPATGETD
jgi:predicted acylesterase/phospholipase RssA